MLTPVPTLIWRAVNRLEGPLSAIRTDAAFLPKKKGPGGLPGPTGDLYLAYQVFRGLRYANGAGRETNKSPRMDGLPESALPPIAAELLHGSETTRCDHGERSGREQAS